MSGVVVSYLGVLTVSCQDITEFEARLTCTSLLSTPRVKKENMYEVVLVKRVRDLFVRVSQIAEQAWDSPYNFRFHVYYEKI